MGEIADAMLSGELCEACGMYIDQDDHGPPQGVPRLCKWCAKALKKPAAKVKRR